MAIAPIPMSGASALSSFARSCAASIASKSDGALTSPRIRSGSSI